MRRSSAVACLLTLLAIGPGTLPGALAHGQWLPLGDGHLSSVPKVGYLLDCQTHFRRHGGAAHSGPWIRGDEWDPADKPTVEGNVTWPDSRISITLEGDKRVIRANNLPKHATGIFPIQENDPAYQYDRNPNSIEPQQILLTLPANPRLAAEPSCVPMGMIGFATDGVAIFNAVDAAGRDAAAHEVQDKCHGHPQHNGQYHYHGPSPCMPNEMTSGLIGYALDGFGIYGMKNPQTGKIMHDSDLDACHGTTSRVMWNGKLTEIYHYVLTPEYPYTIGCFRGQVNPALLQLHGHGGDTLAQGAAPPRGNAGRILARAAASLGIPVARLRAALGPPPPDFERAAQQLGISEQALRRAMREAREQRSEGP